MPENYLAVMRRRNVNLSHLIELGWTNWARAGRRDWPTLQRGACRRKVTTVTLQHPTALAIAQAEQQGMNFSAWVEGLLREAYPPVFLAGGQVNWL